MKGPTENLTIKDWQYERYSFHSAVLKQELPCGFFRSKSAGPIHKTLYLFHGGGGDDAEAVQAGLLPLFAQVLKARSLPLQQIQFVFPFIGKSFLHAHPHSSSRSFSDYFLNDLIPVAEKKTRTSPETRFIGGWSMGGQAALNMFLRFPERFGGVGAHFPTLIDFDYQDPTQQQAYARRQKVNGAMLQILLAGFQNEFVDRDDFLRHDPLFLARTTEASAWAGKKIYFDVGTEDEFGLSEGARVLHEILMQKSVIHHFEVVPHGRHDAPFLHKQIGKMLHYLF